jgi:hypothetical protein
MPETEPLRRRRRKRITVTRATVRSAIANGSRLLDSIDARSAPARRYRDLQDDIARDLGDDLTTTQLQLVRSAAGLVCLREALAWIMHDA